MRLPYLAIAGSGILIAAASGIVGFADGSFLRPLHVDILGQHLTSALIFDVGVYLAVLGVILAALRLLGRTHPRVGSTADSTVEQRDLLDEPILEEGESR